MNKLNTGRYYFLKLFVVILSLSIMGILTYKNRQSLRTKIYTAKFQANSHIIPSAKRELNYRIFKPKTIDDKLLPLVLYLHPWGKNGEDNVKQLNKFLYKLSTKREQTKNPCYILAPQCPSNLEWVNKGSMSTPFRHYKQKENPETEEMKSIIDLINSLLLTEQINPKRIYVVGYSMGATGCWDIISRYPNLFAASVIASGVSDISKADQLTQIPIWAFSGENDSVAPAYLNINMVQAINNQGGKAKITVFNDLGHSISHQAFSYPGLVDWVFLQKKQ